MLEDIGIHSREEPYIEIYLRSDNGAELVWKDIVECCALYGIKKWEGVPYTWMQGVVERVKATSLDENKNGWSGKVSEC